MAISKSTKSITKSKSIRERFSRVLIFKETPEIIYTGLSKSIGQARDLEKNLEDESYFDSKDISISIPLDTTNEFKNHNNESPVRVKVFNIC